MAEAAGTLLNNNNNIINGDNHKNKTIWEEIEIWLPHSPTAPVMGVSTQPKGFRKHLLVDRQPLSKARRRQRAGTATARRGRQRLRALFFVLTKVFISAAFTKTNLQFLRETFRVRCGVSHLVRPHRVTDDHAVCRWAQPLTPR